MATLTMQPLLAPYLRRGASISHPTSVEFAADGHVWVHFNDFLDETRLKALEAELAAKESLLRAARYVVFDLRATGGGNSTWGGRLASILWGKDAVEARLASLAA